MLDNLRKEFPNQDFSFVITSGKILFKLYETMDEFKEDFFNKLESYGISCNLQILQGENKIKYCSKDIFDGNILVCFITNEDNKLIYEFMGVKTDENMCIE